jgi:hypothetical protein
MSGTTSTKFAPYNEWTARMPNAVHLSHMIPSCEESVKNISGVKIEENQLDKNGTTLWSVKNNFQVPTIKQN